MQKKVNNGWRKVKLKEVCREITVGHVGSMANEYVSEGITFLRSQNILPFSLDLSSVKYITPEFHSKLKKSAFSPGDVAVVRTGYPGTACVIPSWLSVSNCADLVIIRPSEEVNSKYLACIFNSTWGQGAVAGNLVGVAQQHFNVSAAKEMAVNLPPRKTQDKIASIIYAYNDLIENNTRRIKILEEMARSLYREWFVNFRFPGHEQVKMVDSELGLIPEGWEVKKVKDIVKRLKAGARYTESNVKKVGDVPVIDQSCNSFLGFHDNPPDHIASLEKPIIIFGDHTCKMQQMIEPFSIGSNVVPFVSQNGIPISYLYFLVSNLVETKEYKRHWTELTNKEVIIAPNVYTEKFTAVIKHIIEQIDCLMKKNFNLRYTRDLLLPKLISGEIDVENLDIETEVTAA